MTAAQFLFTWCSQVPFLWDEADSESAQLRVLGPDSDPWDGPRESNVHLQSAVGELRWKSGWNSAWIFMLKWQSGVRYSDQRDVIKEASSGRLGTLRTGNTRTHAHDTGSLPLGCKDVQGATSPPPRAPVHSSAADHTLSACILSDKE